MLVAMPFGCIVGGRIGTNLLTGTAAGASASAPQVTAPIAMAGDAVSRSADFFFGGFDRRLAKRFRVGAEYGASLGTSLRTRDANQAVIQEASSTFGDRANAHLFVDLLAPGSWVLAPYVEAGHSLLGSGGSYQGPIVTYEGGLEVGASLARCRVGLVHESGTLGDETGPYTATGLTISFGLYWDASRSGDD